MRVKSAMADEKANALLRWQELSPAIRELLSGKLFGLWGAVSDEAAFDSLTVDKQQGLLLILDRLQTKGLWPAVKKISNVYGEGGVGIDFFAWPFIESSLVRRGDFTRRFAKRKAVSGGFYERGPQRVVLHFLYQTAEPRQWHVHFDLYNPLYSPTNAFRHMRYEHFSARKPNWITIAEAIRRGNSHA